MAQRTTVTLIDDLDGSAADQSLEFGLDGATYEIDLSDAHAASLRDALAPYIEHARRSGRGRTRRAQPSAQQQAPSRASSPAASDREQNQAIRDWASRHGHPLSARGRIPASVRDAFHRGDPGALLASDSPSESRSESRSGAPTPAPSPAAADAPTASASEDVAAESTVRTGPDGLTSDERERIRAWAVEEGIEVKARGRLTKDLISNYRAVAARR
ncbi:hypothetical protein Acsp06_52930 [Actinomycetospora sp. NBRC 106375]|nr:hypothetical protein Acsp06_52930 [Actinomycetospora sp. NBRC 106375]